MRKFFTFLLCVVFASVAFGQKPSDVIMKTDTKPVIDGVLDDVYGVANVNAIDKPYGSETPTLGDPGQTNWRALWDNDGIYVFVTVTDNVYLPRYTGTGNAWEYDHAEIYFDTNYDLEDGKGPQTDGNGGGNGHYQFADDITAGRDAGTMVTRTDGVQFAMLADGTNYTEEYFIPFSKLLTGTGGMMDKAQPIGFDVCIIDDDAADTPNTPVRNRAVWSNVGGTNENWVTMDDAGIITLDGADAAIPIDEITIASGGDVTSDNQTVQMVIAELKPSDVTDSTVVWYVLTPAGSNGRATINSKGVLTPIIDGDVEVFAMSPDQFAESNHVTVHISGQQTTRFEVSYIKNGDFNVFNAETLAPGAPWSGGSTVVEGVLNITNTNGQGVNPWDWTVGQNVNIPEELKDDPFVLQLKMWISAPDTFDVDLELIGNDYLRFGNTPDPHSADGRSQWRFVLTTEPTMYTLDISDFSGMDERAQKFNLFAGLTNNTVYVDSVTLVSAADLAFVSTGTKEMAMQEFSVYPNPATSKLNVDLPTANTKVTIYNSVGITMEETIVTGTHHVFDVSNYTRGLYFIKANNYVVKFIR